MRAFKKCKNMFKIQKKTKRLWKKRLKRNNQIQKDQNKDLNQLQMLNQHLWKNMRDWKEIQKNYMEFIW